jgi:hypothetical protein
VFNSKIAESSKVQQLSHNIEKKALEPLLEPLLETCYKPRFESHLLSLLESRLDSSPKPRLEPRLESSSNTSHIHRLAVWVQEFLEKLDAHWQQGLHISSEPSSDAKISQQPPVPCCREQPPAAGRGG